MLSLQEVLKQLIDMLSSLPNGLNWLDYIILVVFFLYAIEGIGVGFVAGVFDFISFIISFILGLKFYNELGRIISHTFSLPSGFSNAFGFFIASFLSEIILSVLLRRLFRFLYIALVPRTAHQKGEVPYRALHSANQMLGIIPGIASAFILLAFLLTLIIALPFSSELKKVVATSRFGSKLVANTQGFEKNLNEVFGGALHETLNFLTVKPDSNEFVHLNFKTTNVSIDEEAERQMLQMVNKERSTRGLKQLVFDQPLRDVARAHSKDMFQKGYFSHYTPEGLSPFDRMEKAHITYQFAGENLALAPSTELAMQGLMQSKGHRDNMLSPHFGKVGIGVIDGGIYGKMYSQEFTD